MVTLMIPIDVNPSTDDLSTPDNQLDMQQSLPDFSQNQMDVIGSQDYSSIQPDYMNGNLAPDYQNSTNQPQDMSDAFTPTHNELIDATQLDTQFFDDNTQSWQDNTNSLVAPHDMSFHDAYDNMARDQLIANQGCLGVPAVPAPYQSPTDSYQFEQAVQRDAQAMRDANNLSFHSNVTVSGYVEHGWGPKPPLWTGDGDVDPDFMSNAPSSSDSGSCTDSNGDGACDGGGSSND